MLQSRLDSSSSHHRHHRRSRRSFGSQNRHRRGARKRTEKNPKRRWPIVVALLVILLVACGAYGFALFRSAMSIKGKAQDAVSLVSTYARAATDGDSAALQESASQMSTAAHDVQEGLDTTIWKVAEYVPVVGSDVHSVRVMSDVLVDLSDNALVPLAQNSGALQLSTLMANSEVNIDALNGLVDAVEAVGPVVERSADAVRDLPPARIAQVKELVGTAQEGLVSASDALRQASPLMPYLSTMLGGDGQSKTYMVLAQDTGEVHATGGFVGWIGYLMVDNGHIELRDFEGVKYALGTEDNAGATDEEIDVFDTPVNSHTGDHNMTPDFSRAGQMYHDTVLALKNEDLDGVIAMDPIFLQYMLELVGPIETSFGVTVDGTNAASLTLNRCMFWWSGKECDDFYSEVSNLAFHKVLNGLSSVDTMEFLATLGRSAAEEHCMVWTKDASIEAAVQQAGFGGELDHDATHPVTGVYFNDRTTSKSSYYLSAEAQVGEGTRNEDGSTSYAVQLTIKNNMSRSLLADGLPSYLTVRREDRRSDADLYEDTYLMAPEGGTIEIVSATRLNSSVAGPEPKFTEKSYQGLQTWKSADLRIDADEVVVISYRVMTSPEATEPLEARVTPLVPEEIAFWNEK